MKPSKAIACITSISLLAIFSPAQAQKLESGTAGATTTPQYAKKVAQTYCDFLKAGVSQASAIRQAESEVATSSAKPQPFNQYIYNQTLNKAINEKGFCPGIEGIEEIKIEQLSCSLSPRDLETLSRSKHIKRQVGDCFLSITAH
ncbi:hypothetical protein FZZ91_10375 [Synechococcus sp. HB1133]|uniref:hypothetical protein n=1 Tax=unclassified Synechococcus TaxID=2626047 RepID=UPI0014085150|nr:MULTISPECIES: hypothetical protein [unclassified Synechococcus]MCB4393465.1 hypothetical protein [Synechococcus sp. PH41509]MCB4423233.1 hypothetical protein [Synechococcus sp. HB1133]